MENDSPENKILDLLSTITWGLDFSRFKRVISGNVVEDYEFEKSVHFGGTLSRHKRPGRRNSRVRRAFSISRARLRIRRLISANSGQYGCRDIFITFTFAENKIALKEANKCWTEFIKRLNYHLGFKVKYVAVVEFQKRGAVHYHCIFFNLPFLPDIKENFSRIWSHGFINIQSVKKIRSVGAYLSKYLQKGVVDARLFNEKCYFSSRGLKKPIVSRHEPVDISFDNNNTVLKLEDSKEYYSQWTGKIKYKRYILKR